MNCDGWNESEICTYQTCAEDFRAVKDTVYSVSRVVEQLEKVQVELHPQLRGLNSVLQLLVLSRLCIHRSIRRLEGGRDVELCLLGLPDQEQKTDRSSGALVGCRKVFQPLKLGGLICGIPLHIVRSEHCLARQLSRLQLGLLVPAYPQPHGRLGDGWKVCRHEYVHEHVEIGLLQRVLSLTSEAEQPSKVHYSQF